MATEEKKQKSFAKIAQSITKIVKKPLTKEEVSKINSILENNENGSKTTEKPPKAASSNDSEANI